jgi:hypothetical protein
MGSTNCYLASVRSEDGQWRSVKCAPLDSSDGGGLRAAAKFGFHRDLSLANNPSRTVLAAP